MEKSRFENNFMCWAPYGDMALRQSFCWAPYGDMALRSGFQVGSFRGHGTEGGNNFWALFGDMALKGLKIFAYYIRE